MTRRKGPANKFAFASVVIEYIQTKKQVSKALSKRYPTLAKCPCCYLIAPENNLTGVTDIIDRFTSDLIIEL